MTTKEKYHVEQAIESINQARRAIVAEWSEEQVVFLDKVDDFLIEATVKLREIS